ncbi:MAG: hypothetical protein RI967_1452 [Planctomycetota bacterium]
MRPERIDFPRVPRLRAITVGATAAILVAIGGARAQDGPSQETPSSATATAAAAAAATATATEETRELLLADARPEESESLNRLATARAWTSRALAAMRYERYGCEPSAAALGRLAGDGDWRVRAYAWACLARRGVEIPAERLAAEADPRVLRAMVRGRYAVPSEVVDARLRPLERSGDLFQAMVALEVLVAVDTPIDRAAAERLAERRDELLSRIVLRMDRTEGGTLSSRLAAITSGSDSGRNYRWREWYRKSRRDPGYRSAAIVPARPEGARQVLFNKVASLAPERFVAFEKYLAAVAERPMDLAILIDSTASMSREIADAQGGIDDLFAFLGSVTKGVRIGIVGYRDRTDEWETKAWDFTSSLAEARKNLWSLSADGGGDTPESVHPAIKLALTKFSWMPDVRADLPQPIRACVIVGDAPPHPGTGDLCIDLARRAAARGVRFYGIVARDSETNLEPESPRSPDPATTPEPGAPESDPPALADREGAPEDPPATRRGGRQVAPPSRPKPLKGAAPAKADTKARSYTLFPEIAAAGNGRAAILADHDSLVARIAELTVADEFGEEFADFFEGFRLLCR